MTEIKTEIYQDSAILVGLITPQQNEDKATEYLDELAFLAETAGATPIKRFLQRLDYSNPKTFVGQGKLEEIKTYIADNEFEGRLFSMTNCRLCNSKNIEKELKSKY